MNVDQFLEYFVSHSLEIIGILAIVVLILFAISLFLDLSTDKTRESNQSELKNLEETLRKVIDSAPRPSSEISDEKSAVPSPGSGDVDQVDALKSLQENLSLKEGEIEQLKAELTKAKDTAEKAGGSDPSANDELQAKLAELQSKLAEYEIIEDDIANLSLYKEENQRLKDELDKLKGGDSEASEEVAPAAEAEPSAQEEKKEAAGKEEVAEEAVEAEEVTTEAPKTEEKATDDADDSGDDIMAQFAAAVGEDAPEAKEETPVTDTDKTEEEDMGVLGDFDTDKLVSEAAELKVDENASGDEPVGVEVDPDKLVSEAAELGGEVPTDSEENSKEAVVEAKSDESKEELKPEESTSEAKPEEPGEKAKLETTVTETEGPIPEPSPEKLLNEAEELKSAPVEDKSSESDEEGDVGEKLISEFEEFVKNESESQS